MKVKRIWDFCLPAVGLLILIVSLLIPACRPGDTGPGAAGEAGEASLLPDDQAPSANSPERTEIFRDAGLGLFIHWGPNSQVGSEISWPLWNASEDYIDRYYALADSFNPVRFDAWEWARLARLAGMEYVVFTTKHHDGFCMFDTGYSDFKITNSPFQRDVTAEIVEAFRAEGLLVGFYYSPGDFRYHHETGVPPEHLMTPAFESETPFGPKKASFLEYEQGHLRELLSGYGDIFMMWFDGQCDPLKKYAWRIKPEIFIGRGEIPTPEQRIPDEAADHAWESCMTTSWQWSYEPTADLRTAREIIWNLIHIRARGGNMLLNVGPRPDGVISPPDEARLRELGLWMMGFGEAVRGVRPWTVTHEYDVWFTHDRKENTIYAFCDLDYDAAGVNRQRFSGRRLTLTSVRATDDTEISVVGQKGLCAWSQDETGLHIEVFNTHTVKIIKRPEPKRESATSDRTWFWGPDWPVAVRITHPKAAPRELSN